MQLAQRVSSLVLATRHLGAGSPDGREDDADRAVILDVDLSILGQSPRRSNSRLHGFDCRGSVLVLRLTPDTLAASVTDDP